MYFRPGNLLKDFTVEARETQISTRGRPSSSFPVERAVHIKAVLAEAKPEEKDRWQQIGHPISHVITQRGPAKAETGNRLIHGNRVFYIQGVDNVAELGIATIYYALERSDQDGNAN